MWSHSYYIRNYLQYIISRSTKISKYLKNLSKYWKLGFTSVSVLMLSGTGSFFSSCMLNRSPQTTSCSEKQIDSSTLVHCRIFFRNGYLWCFLLCTMHSVSKTSNKHWLVLIFTLSRLLWKTRVALIGSLSSRVTLLIMLTKSRYHFELRWATGALIGLLSHRGTPIGWSMFIFTIWLCCGSKLARVPCNILVI